jgi:hypothetical protein
MCHNLISNWTFNVIYATMNTEHHIFQVVDIYMLHCVLAVSEHAHCQVELWKQVCCGFPPWARSPCWTRSSQKDPPLSSQASKGTWDASFDYPPYPILCKCKTRSMLYTSSHWFLFLFFQIFLCCVVGQHLKRDLALNGNRFLFLSFEAQQETWPGKLLKLDTPKSSTWAERASRSFPCTPLGLKPRTFLRSQGPRLGYTSGPSPLG